MSCKRPRLFPQETEVVTCESRKVNSYPRTVEGSEFIAEIIVDADSRAVKVIQSYAVGFQ